MVWDMKKPKETKKQNKTKKQNEHITDSVRRRLGCDQCNILYE